ncbi:response regulator receiver domain containing protein [Nitzschia inconspicua]|uniref:Response regulator receiver domain containing protein n=1 Tax=Nitzschia inconspicua TaxID=303405 RepID=A0A9K3Q5H5_9STRA|nr:response regulator receiver domain containing protein [Nitzschia inconspicua]
MKDIKSSGGGRTASGTKLHTLGYHPEEGMTTSRSSPSIHDDYNDNMMMTMEDVAQDMDWVLTNYDEKNSQPQTMEEEMKRLQALRSYLILDSERESQFERLIAMGKRIFSVPMTSITLIDLGRQWIVSSRGLGDMRETPRNEGFCTHAILSKDDIFIIKDASKDWRFANNPYVTGPPYLRFYAGAPLESPEGYRLGTFCIIDTKPWPNGLDFNSKQTLRELAALTVDVLVTRRNKRERELQRSTQMVACTAHDLLTPLSGIELSLHLLQEDQDFQRKLASQHHRHAMETVQVCSDILQEICSTVKATHAITKSSFEESLMTAQLERVNIKQLVDRLYIVTEPIEKHVPLQIVVDDSVPKEVMTDPSKILRGAINYLTIACQRTRNGKIVLRLALRKSSEYGKRSLLFVTCEDTAPPIPLDMYQHLFKPPQTGVDLFKKETVMDNNITHNNFHPELCLFSVACEMNVIGGEFGFRPRNDADEGCKEYDEETGMVSGSVFWFCLPCSELEEGTVVEETETTTGGSSRHTALAQDDATKSPRSIPRILMTHSQRKKRALVIDDSMVIRKMLTKILSNLEFEVSQAENGMDGLEKLKSTLFDLAFCDFLMPIMDGLDCVQQYRDWEKSHRPWIKQRIVGISAHATPEDIEIGTNVGMDDYRNKPMTVKVLSELINCESQAEISKLLDEIERREENLRITAGSGCSSSALGEHPTNDLDSEKLGACLLVAPKSEDEHTKSMQELIKSSGWQSIVARTEEEALTWLKMRMWDLVLVDESFASSIAVFRSWELSNRKAFQKRVTLMTEAVDITAAEKISPPKGIDAVTLKPMSLSSLDNLLRRTQSALNGDDQIDCAGLLSLKL